MLLFNFTPISLFSVVSIVELAVIDLILLSHEDPDNLDSLGRTLLNGRRVFTTVDGKSQIKTKARSSKFNALGN